MTGSHGQKQVPCVGRAGRASVAENQLSLTQFLWEKKVARFQRAYSGAQNRVSWEGVTSIYTKVPQGILHSENIEGGKTAGE